VIIKIFHLLKTIYKMLLQIWIFLSLVVGMLGRRTAFGFWGTFIFSLFLSPVIIMIYVLISKKSKGSIKT